MPHQQMGAGLRGLTVEVMLRRHHNAFCTAYLCSRGPHVNFLSRFEFPFPGSAPQESRPEQLSRPLELCLAALSFTPGALAGHDAAKKVTCKEQPSAVTRLSSGGISGVRSLHP